MHTCRVQPLRTQLARKAQAQPQRTLTLLGIFGHRVKRRCFLLHSFTADQIPTPLTFTFLFFIFLWERYCNRVYIAWVWDQAPDYMFSFLLYKTHPKISLCHPQRIILFKLWNAREKLWNSYFAKIMSGKVKFKNFLKLPRGVPYNYKSDRGPCRFA